MASRLMDMLFMWGLASFYGMAAILQTVKAVFTHGYGKVFTRVKRDKSPECLQDPNLGTHGFLHLEDVKIHYVAKGPEDKPLMLFLHGFPEFWYSWRNQLPVFSTEYRCVAIDMRGYGESDKPTGVDKYTIVNLMKDVQQVIAALGYKSCVLVAHDWGGAVAWSFARQFPDYVDKLVVMNSPPGPVFKKLLKTDKKQLKMSWYMFLFQLPVVPEFFVRTMDFFMLDQTFGTKAGMANPLTPQQIEPYKYTFSKPGALTPPLNYYRASFRYPGKISDMDYAMPVLLVWGMNDMALSSRIPEEVEKQCPSVTVKRIPDCGHFVQIDAPDKVNAIMREWLSPSQD